MSCTLVEDRFESFFEAPFNAYGKDSLYVSPLKSDLKRFVNADQNPLFESADDISIFAVERDGQAIGRICAHVHCASNQLYGWNRAYFGYFDCADDNQAGNMLLNAVENWARTRGFNEIVGNFNLTAMQQIGVMTDQFTAEPFTDLVYNPKHIPKLLEASGYTAEFPMTTFSLDLTTAVLPTIGSRQQAILDDPDFEFIAITRRNVKQRMEQARQILNTSFAKNPMFVPVSEKEFHFQAKDMAWVIDPRISAMLTWRGHPIATILCVPDMNPFLQRTRSRMSLSAPWHFIKHKFSNKRAVLIFSAVAPQWQGKGVNPLVLRRVILAMQEAGYRVLGNTWIADVNPASLAQKEKSGATPLHRLHLYKKTL